MKRNSAFQRISPVQRALQPNNLMDRIDALERGAKRQQVRNVVVNYITDIVNNASYPTVEQTVVIINEQTIEVNTINNWQNVFLFDEFVSPSEASSTGGDILVGELGWISSANTSIQLLGISPTSGFYEHYGMVNVSNDATLSGYIHLNSMYLAIVKAAQYICSFTAVANTGDGYAFGLLNESAGFAVDGTVKGACFRFEDDGAGTNWLANTTDGVGTTETDTGVPFSVETWYLFEIKQPTIGTIEFYINQVLVATHTTNVETADAFEVSPVFGVNGTTVLDTYLDYFAMQLVPITQRWD